MFVVETKVPAHSILVDFHNVHFWKMPLELFYRKDFFQPKWPHINTRPPKNLLKKQAAWWFKPDNKLCLVTPLIVTSISYQYKLGRTGAFVEPVEFQNKGHSHTLLEAPPLTDSNDNDRDSATITPNTQKSLLSTYQPAYIARTLGRNLRCLY